jgi:hypothetical protein
MIDPALFDQLKTKIEEDTSVRKELDQILDDLNQHVSYTQGVLSRIHSTPRSKCQFLCAYTVVFYPIHETDSGLDATLLGQVEDGIKKEIETVGKLSVFASQYPYYK